MRKIASSFPFCLIFLPLFYLINLYSQNISEIELDVVLRPSLILILLAGLVYAAFYLISKDRNKSVLLAFIALFLLLNYGLIYSLLRDHPVVGVALGRHSVLGAIWAVLLVALLILAPAKRVKISSDALVFLNLVTAVLLVYTLATTVIRKIDYETSAREEQTASVAISPQQEWLAEVSQPLAAADTLPDIYYIIPDMFARTDAIRGETGYDNSAFLDELRALGFYVAECSRSNYASTQLSIASSLNMTYLQDIQQGMTSRPMLVVPMNNSLVRTSLEQIGYQTVVFENGFGLPEIRDADVKIAYEGGFFLFEPNNPFENLVVKNSLLRILYDVDLGAFSQAYDKLFFPYWRHVDAQKHIFDELPGMVDVGGPKFVFVHIMMPHPPFLIREDGAVETNSDYYREALGQPINEELYLEGYLMQVKYVQSRLLEAVTGIIEGSETPPVIIIQGDHGIRDNNRMDILNAYYAPQAVSDSLYPTITPVNTFRLLFNGVFGTHYERLPDISNYSVYPDWFDLQVEPERNPACAIAP